MAAPTSFATLAQKEIKFGTDGWRGVIAADFTFERVAHVAPIAAEVLEQVYGSMTGSRTVIVGYDRRFLSPEFARTAAEAIQAVGYDVMLADRYAPTPAFSWAAKDQGALGAIVITASHNPAAYSGLKVKSALGGSVPPDITQKIEARLDVSPEPSTPGQLQTFDPWPSYCNALRSKVDVDTIQAAIANGKLTVFADVMHGAAATGLEKLLNAPIHELHSSADPLFEGGAPEPLPKYLSQLLDSIRSYQPKSDGELVVGLVFDGDSDRIAAVDGKGNFLSSQILIPILIEHLSTRRSYHGEVVKTISGSDLIPKLAEHFNLALHETPIGYKYIADRMRETQVLIGGEESGGIGYGHHIPERDALLSALYVLEAVLQSDQDLSAVYERLQDQTGFHSKYDRIDLPLANMEVRSQLIQQLQEHPLEEIAGKTVVDCLTIDGYKFRLEDGSWLLVRFSGTEPVLRLYCEASTLDEVHKTLNWAADWAKSIG
jgi:phosphomannomutase